MSSILLLCPLYFFDLAIVQESVVSGSLLEDFEPAVNPPKEIDDPTDKKPSDWVDEATYVYSLRLFYSIALLTSR